MKELLEIYNASELPIETRVRIINKMVKVLDYQMGTNVYKEIADELCGLLHEQFKNK